MSMKECWHQCYHFLREEDGPEPGIGDASRRQARVPSAALGLSNTGKGDWAATILPAILEAVLEAPRGIEKASPNGALRGRTVVQPRSPSPASHRRSRSVLAPPALGLVEPPCPDASLLRPGKVLIRNVLGRVPSVGNRPALPDHPGSNVLPLNRASRYRSTPRVHIGLHATYSPGAKQVTKGQRRSLAAAVRFSLHLAELTAFWRVDAVQPDARPAHLDGVPIETHDPFLLPAVRRGLAGALPRLAGREHTALSGNAGSSPENHRLP